MRICVYAPLLVAGLILTLGCSRRPSVEEARTFLDGAEAKLFTLSEESGRAAWVQSTYITGDTEALAARANQRQIDAVVDLVKQSKRFDGVKLPEELDRKLKLLKLSLTMAAPSDPKLSEELTRIAARMEGAYGKGRACKEGEKDQSKCLDINQVTKVMAESRNPAELLQVWRGWEAVGEPLRKDYQRFVELSNQGAREIGYADSGAMWRSKYDMPADDFPKELDRLWEQVRPLYVSLHAYVRNRLREKYGESVVPASGPIPAHLLGNPWAQEWGNIYPLVAPPNADPGFDLTQILKSRKVDEREMVRYGDRFFVSLGFQPLPPSFWDRSLFTKPRDREVVCHASAWDVDNLDDLRIKMCIEITGEDFITVHHELGHNFYQRAYNKQPMLFRDSANDGFHEALGDTIALSMTPDYFVKLGSHRQPHGPLQGHRPAAEQGAGEDRLSAVRAADRSMALEGLFGPDPAGEVQPDLVGAAAEVSGRGGARGPHRERLRSRGQVPRAGQRPLHPLLPGGRAPVPVS